MRSKLSHRRIRNPLQFLLHQKIVVGLNRLKRDFKVCQLLAGNGNLETDVSQVIGLGQTKAGEKRLINIDTQLIIVTIIININKIVVNIVIPVRVSIGSIDIELGEKIIKG